jgi:predicted Zn finger-like uncharacterized protein
MIIACNNCHKKFDIDSNLIPEKGRLLQCNSCNHKWFFKKEIINDPVEAVEVEKEETIELLDKASKIEVDASNNIQENEIETPEEKISNVMPTTKRKKQRNFKILNLLIIFLISFTSFIIILDTFKSPIGKIVPNTEFLLYNLYESFKDIVSFIKDLI